MGNSQVFAISWTKRHLPAYQSKFRRWERERNGKRSQSLITIFNSAHAHAMEIYRSSSIDLFKYVFFLHFHTMGDDSKQQLQVNLLSHWYYVFFRFRLKKNKCWRMRVEKEIKVRNGRVTLMVPDAKCNNKVHLKCIEFLFIFKNDRK